jgi:hypothetical protein
MPCNGATTTTPPMQIVFLGPLLGADLS